MALLLLSTLESIATHCSIKAMFTYLECLPPFEGYWIRKAAVGDLTDWPPAKKDGGFTPVFFKLFALPLPFTLDQVIGVGTFSPWHSVQFSWVVMPLSFTLEPCAGL